MVEVNLQKVIDIFKIIAYTLINKDPESKAIKLIVKKIDNDGSVTLFINCFADDPRDVGKLLGKKTHTPRTKDAIVKILMQTAYYAGISKIDLTIDDISKLPKNE